VGKLQLGVIHQASQTLGDSYHEAGISSQVLTTPKQQEKTARGFHSH
jgi:hypothetical protein